MPGKKPHNSESKHSISESVDIITQAIAGFDFRVDSDDFVLYELNRMIEEDRASFEDEEFRILVDEGIQQHVEENLQIRAELAGALRNAAMEMNDATQSIARRVIRALENTGFDLRNAGVVVRTYTAYLFERLQSLQDTSILEHEARALAESWSSGALSTENLTSGIRHIGEPALGPIAELLFSAPENHQTAEVALGILTSIRSAVSARILAHAISEPVLDEIFEMQAYTSLRETWPLARPFILHNIDAHAHEDLPFRWFQLLIDAGDVSSSQRIYDELCVHGGNPNFHEDLWGLTMLLAQSRDPEIEDQVLAWLNSAKTPASVVPMLQEFLKDYKKPQGNAEQDSAANPWIRQATMQSLNEDYVSAAELWDAGKFTEAQAALDRILAQDSEYPFARMLKSISSRYRT
jgi:hypothetical protein